MSEQIALAMSDDKIEDIFAGVKEEFFPGSKQRIPTGNEKKPYKAPNLEAWDKNPKVYNVKGVPTEFFTVGALAHALNRQAVTIRLWEREGRIPKAQFKTPDPNGLGGRRLYTRAQVEGMVKIALTEGIWHETYKPVGTTRFTERVIELFTELNVKSD